RVRSSSVARASRWTRSSPSVACWLSRRVRARPRARPASSSEDFSRRPSSASSRIESLAGSTSLLRKLRARRVSWISRSKAIDFSPGNKKPRRGEVFRKGTLFKEGSEPYPRDRHDRGHYEHQD